MKEIIELLSALVNKNILVNVRDKSGNVVRGYVYNVNTETYVVTTEYIGKFIEPRNWDSRFKKLRYDNITMINIAVVCVC